MEWGVGALSTLAGIDVLVLCSAAHESEPVLPCADLSGWCEED